MNDDRWMQAIAEKQKEIDAMREVLKRLKALIGMGKHCCYCGTTNPHAKTCEEALGMISEKE